MKKYFLFFMVVYLFFAHTVVFAATSSPSNLPTYSGVSSEIQKYLCAPTDASKDQGNTPMVGTSTAAANSSASRDLYRCINQLYKFAIILGSSISVFFVVVAGYIYMSADGNQESVDKAKDILISSITAMVILLGGFLLLKAINPDLIEFKSIQPPSVKLDTTGWTASSTPPGGGGGNSQQLAQQILGLSSSISVNSSSCDCPGNCPNNTLQSLAAGNKATFDGPGSTCNAGTTAVNGTMLQALVTAANNGSKFMITSMTGGHHSAAGDPHYTGNAVDVVPQPSTASSQAALVQSLRQSGATKIGLECNGGYTALTGSNDSSTACIGQSGYHIHAQW